MAHVQTLDTTTTMEDLEANSAQMLARQFQFSSCTTTKSPLLVDHVNVNALVVGSVSDTSAAAPAPAPAATSSNISSSSSIGGRDMVVIPAAEKKKPAATRSIKVVLLQANSRRSLPPWACLVPTTDDPIDTSFIMCLDSIRDIGRINPVHILIRRHVFEVRRTLHTGRIFFQCACCKHRPRSDRAKLSTVAPQGVNSIYRSFVRFMMEHVPACQYIPYTIRSLDARTTKVANYICGGGSDTTAATTRCGGGIGRIEKYWAWSAKEMGLMDGIDHGKIIVYRGLPATVSDWEP